MNEHESQSTEPVDTTTGSARQTVRVMLVALRDTLLFAAGIVPAAIVLLGALYVRFNDGSGFRAVTSRFADLYEQDPMGLAVLIRWEWLGAIAAAAMWSLVVAWWFWHRRSDDEWDAPGLELSPANIAVAGAATGFTTMLVRVLGIVPLILLGYRPGDPALDQVDLQALGQFDGMFLLCLVFLAVVVAPVAEELFFRGRLLRYAAPRCGSGFAIVLSAAVFALVHLHPALIPIHFIAGLVLGWSYERWRNIAIPVIGHSIVNFVAMVPFIFN